MAVKCKEIISIMEQWAPKALAEKWDNSGLSVGSCDALIDKVLVALDVTPHVLQEAVDIGANMIITHHPLILFQTIKSITPDTPLGAKIYHLIKHNIAAYAAHTNLDIAKGGTNDVLAELLGITSLEILEETGCESLYKLCVYVPMDYQQKVCDAVCEAGAGHVGNYSHCTFRADGIGSFMPLEGTKPFIGNKGTLTETPEIKLETIVPKSSLDAVIKAMLEVHPYEEVAYDIYPLNQKGEAYGIGRIGDLSEPVTFGRFADIIKQKLSLDTIRLVGDNNKMINRVGLCTGSGAEFLELAKAKGADAYITGDIKFHEAQKAIEMGLCVADATHFASEVIIVPAIAAYLRQATNGRLVVEESKSDGQTFWHK